MLIVITAEYHNMNYQQVNIIIIFDQQLSTIIKEPQQEDDEQEVRRKYFNYSLCTNVC